MSPRAPAADADEDREVLVIGGGPAGAATARLFARAGHDVLLCDAARFPRDKVCGESVSPGAWPALDALDLAGAVRALDPQPIHGMQVSAPCGARFRGSYRGAERAGFALRRLTLDDMLLHAAQAAGAEVRQAARAVDLLRDGDGGARGAVVEGADGRRTRVRARLLVGADGRRGIVARRLGLLREHPRLRKYAVRGHFEGVQGLEPWGELHVVPGAYCGVAPLGPGRANVAFVVDQTELGQVGGDVAAYYARRLTAWPRVAERLSAARLLGPPRAVGPLALEARAVWAPGVLLTGDAAGFFDPFTGEGITLALRSAQWAFEAGARALKSPGGTRDLRDYAARRRAATRDKFRLNRLLYEVLRRPAAADLLARHLSRRPRAADRLVGIAGDFVPSREAWSLGLLAELLRA